MLADEFANLPRVLAVNSKRRNLFRQNGEAMDSQMVGDAGFLRQLRHRRSLIHAILGHVAVGGPFSAADRHQSGAIDVNDMVARECSSADSAFRASQRANACENTQDVVSRWRLVQVIACDTKNELDFLLD